MMAAPSIALAVIVAVTEADTPVVRLAVAAAEPDAVFDAVLELDGVSEAVALAPPPPAAGSVAVAVGEEDAEDPVLADRDGVRVPVRERVGVDAAVGVRAAVADGSGVGVLHACTGMVVAVTSSDRTRRVQALLAVEDGAAKR